MKLIFIRHGDPDYEHDSLTERGRQEAELLSLRWQELKGDYYYVSPLGRARETAAPFLKKAGCEAVEMDWLREFEGRCLRPDLGREWICWDWMPDDMAKEPRFLSRDEWLAPEVFAESNVPEQYDYVISSFDKLLEDHGYRRNGTIYEAVRPNHDTLVFFCHFGVTAVMLSRLMNVSPMVLWHGMVAAPTSVTTVYTEERREGIASFRMGCFGETAHLRNAGLEPSFSARFCECFTDNTRHV